MNKEQRKKVKRRGEDNLDDRCMVLNNMPEKHINTFPSSDDEEASKPKKRKITVKDMPGMTAQELKQKAKQFLESKKNANKLVEILELFKCETNHYGPVLLTVQNIFTELLRRGDMVEIVDPEKPTKDTPATIYARWLRANYELTLKAVVSCMKRGNQDSRLQALVTACKLLREEGQNPLKTSLGAVFFPKKRLESIFAALLDEEESTTALIGRFREFACCRDVQQQGLRSLAALARPSPSQVYIQNYLELFTALMAAGTPTGPRSKSEPHSDDVYYLEKDGEVGLIFNPEDFKRSVNKCWDRASQWPLCGSEATHRRALRVLVDDALPLLTRPQLVTDLLCDSLDCSAALSSVALRGVADLVTKHNIQYPGIYDRLYGLLAPAALATRANARLLHTAETFLASTHIPGSMVAAFAKRLSRLALLAAPADCLAMLRLIGVLMKLHPDLRRLLRDDHHAIMPKDPYIMEESCATASQAIKSSLWEVSALRRHFAPEVSAAAARLLADDRAAPAQPPAELTEFDRDLKMWFKNIEMNFVRATGFENAPPCERVGALWDMEV